ncbi:MAG TPA: GNAT family N-acetyltransferase [Allosphingosinicella sp.]|jgi:GNAT superfamily N-acetyltransferase
MGEIEHLHSGRLSYTAPEPTNSDHRLDVFDCGKAALNDFLRRRALKNDGRASRTYVLTATTGEQAGAVVAFYTLAAGAVPLAEVPKKLSRNMPNPVPAMVLGRMAVDEHHKGKGLGRAMLQEAMSRVLTASREVGARALVVHAIDDEAVTFYTQYGFQVFPTGSRTLFLPIETIAASLN